MRVSFVGYRDYGDPERFVPVDFTEDIHGVKQLIKSQKAEGGGDTPEDVQGAFNKALNMSWDETSIKFLVFCTDAPGHGFWKYDDYPNGLPENFKLEQQMKSFADKRVHFTFLKLDSNCN